MTPARARLEVTRRASADIRRIYFYTLEHWDREQAEHYEARVRQAMNLLIDNPELGAPRGDLRSLAIERHVIWYRYRKDVVTVTRVLHGRQQVPRSMFSQSEE